MQELFEAELHIKKYGEFNYRAREWRSERRIIFRVDSTMSDAQPDDYQFPQKKQPLTTICMNRCGP